MRSRLPGRGTVYPRRRSRQPHELRRSLDVALAQSGGANHDSCGRLRYVTGNKTLTEQSLRSGNGGHCADRDQHPSDCPSSRLWHSSWQEQAHTRPECSARSRNKRNLRNGE